ncbi:MAG: hypothetical protein KC457_12045, partial [Myxococcales bacterium]|nr:hypothetical protein [Myxococcales bacterium]
IEVWNSNGDGTFAAPFEIGIPYGGNTPQQGDYAIYYAGPSIADYDGDGRLDMLMSAYRSPNLPRELWWFERVGPQQFTQRLVDADPPSFYNRTIDLDGDHAPDNFTYEVDKFNNGFIAAMRVYGLALSGDVRTANCAVSDDPLNPGGCVFVRSQPTDLSPWYLNQWQSGFPLIGRDLDGDGSGDLLITKYASGGASPSPIGRIDGLGGGTFTNAPALLLTHPLPVNTMVIEDFDEDGVYDFIGGCDDDGDPGSLWFYPGVLNQGTYTLDGVGAFETIDFGNSGHNCAAHAFDWDGDGHLDLITGHNTGGVYATPTELNYFRGLGDGHFDPPITLATYPGLEAWRMVGPSLF